MDVIAHEAVRVQGAARAEQHPRQVEEVERPVLFTKEARTTVVAALDRVDSHARKDDSRVSRHARSTAMALFR
jgi:hypothetical protein